MELPRATTVAAPAGDARSGGSAGTETPGFGVKVTPAGRKVFIVLYRVLGGQSRLRKYTIGPYGQVTLQQARLLELGQNPIDGSETDVQAVGQQVALSAGSACAEAGGRGSHVLRAMGLPSPRTQNSIRISLGAGNTDDHVERFIETLPRVVGKLRTVTGVRR